MVLNLYLVSRRDRWSHDDWDAFVVAAPSEDEAKDYMPNGSRPFVYVGTDTYDRSGWVSDKSLLEVTLLGTADPGTETGVILGSFNAG